MNSIFKRSLSLFLAFVMCLSMVPFAAFAEEEEPELTEEVQEEVQAPAAVPEEAVEPPAEAAEVPAEPEAIEAEPVLQEEQAAEPDELPEEAEAAEELPESEGEPAPEEASAAEEPEESETLPEEATEEAAETEAETAPEETEAEEATETAEEESAEEAEPEEAKTTDPVITILSQPEDAEIIDGIAVFSVTAAVEPADAELSYQWQKLDNSVEYATEEERETAWADIEEETEDTLQITGQEDEAVFEEALAASYRCVLTSGDVKVITEEVQLIASNDKQESKMLVTAGTGSSIIATGTCGENLTWELDENGLLIISGEGTIDCYYDSPWYDYRSMIDSILVNDGVTSIEFGAFENFSNLTSITIPSSLTSIGAWVFDYCDSLTNITIPSSVTSINDYAFSRSGITRILFTGNAPSISKYALRDQTTAVYYPLTAMGWDGIAGKTFGGNIAWYGYQTLDENGNPTGVIRLSSGTCGENLTWELDKDGLLTITGEGNMEDNPWVGLCEDIKKVVIADGITNIGYRAFDGCRNMTNITIPSTVTSIGEGAFDFCCNLTSITIPNSVTSIGYEAFAHCRISKIVFPDSVMSIGGFVFSWSGLKSINVVFTGDAPLISEYALKYETMDIYYPQTATGWESIIGSTFGGNTVWYSYETIDANGNPVGISKIKIYSGKCGENLTWKLDEKGVLTISGEGEMDSHPWFGVCEEIREVVITDGVTGIGDNAFCDCINLASIKIPSSVKNIGTGAFSDCSSLSSFEIPYGVANIEFETFVGCNNLVSVEIPSSVISIGGEAFFNCNSLKSITIPSSVKTIGGAAFSECICLKRITFEGSAPVIQSDIFHLNTTAIAFYPENDPSWNSSTKKNYGGNLLWLPAGSTIAVSGSCGTNVNYELLDDTLTISGTGEMQNYREGTSPWSKYSSFVENIIIEPGVKQIGDYSFCSCSNVTKIEIPETITTIGNYAFAGCASLAEIIIPESTVNFGRNIFVNCPSIRSAGPVGSGCDYQFGWRESIPTSAFEGLTRLERLQLPEGIVRFGQCAFLGCSSLETVLLPDSLEDIYAGAFSGCSSLKNIVIPKNVRIIGENAFYNCFDLEKVEFRGDAPWFYNNCFFGVTAEAYYPQNAQNWQSSVMQNYGGNITWRAYDLSAELLNTPVLKSAVSNASGITVSWKAVPGAVKYRVLCKTAVTGWRMAGDTTSTSLGVTGLSSGIKYAFTVRCINDDGTAYTSNYDPDGISAFYYASEGTCGANLSWSLSSDGVLTISGTGTMNDYDYRNDICAPWQADKVTSVVIEDGVSGIGADAFYNCSNLTDISIPGSVSTIGENAFGGCGKLEDIYYSGTADEWRAISVGAGNAAFTNTLLHSDFTMTVALRVSGNGTAAGEGTYLQGDNVTVKAIAEPQNVFYGWLDKTGMIVSRDIEYSFLLEEDKELIAKFIPIPELAFGAEYILLQTGATENIELQIIPYDKDVEQIVEFNVENADEKERKEILTIAAEGSTVSVTAKAKGTAYVVAELSLGGETYTARCRVDVTEKEVFRAVTNVSLADTKAAVELFSTDYAKVKVLLEMDQLLSKNTAALMSTSASGKKDSGAAIDSAHFTDAKTAELFDLIVLDDRTLEIVPKDSTVADAKNKTLKIASSYKSGIAVFVDGVERKATQNGKEQILAITVKQTLPKLKPAALKFNSADKYEILSMAFTGGKVTALEPDEAAAAKAKSTAVPNWMEVNRMDAHLKEDAPQKASGKLYLLAEVEGLAVKVPVAVSYSVVNTPPVMKFKTATMTLLPGSCDRQSTEYTVTPAAFADPVKYPVTVSRIMEGTATCNNSPLQCDIDGGVITVKPLVNDGKAHTYKVFLKVAGKEFSLTVKTLAPTAKPTLKMKQSGGIEANLKHSSVNLTATMKNYHAGSGETYTVQVLKTKGKETGTDVTESFQSRVSGNVVTLELADDASAVESGYTYTAYVKADLGGGNTVTSAPVKLNIKWTPSAKLKPTVTLKASGAIDILRSATAVKLAVTTKNVYGYALEDATFEFFGNGKVLGNVSPFQAEVKDGAIEITLKPGETANPTVKYSVRMTLTADGQKYVSGGDKQTATAFSLKMGAAKVASDVKDVTLFLKDRYSTDKVKLTVSDPVPGKIAEVKLDATSAKQFSLEPLGNGKYAIGFLGNCVPAGLKAGAKTVKLSVYLAGNPIEKANATISIKVNIK